MGTIHFIQQGKGGVGKSVVAVILYQTLTALGKDVAAFDTDPVNATLSSYAEFGVTSLDILKNDNIDARAFDQLLDELFYLPEQMHAIVDNGASSFVALGAYIKENALLSLLREQGPQVFFHTVITGGQALGDTLSGLKVLAEGFPDTPIVVWLNPYFGEIQRDGKGFEQFQIYQDFFSQFQAIITLPQGNKATIGKDLEELFAKRMSFKAGIDSSSSIAVRSRLNRYWQSLIAVVEQAGIA